MSDDTTAAAATTTATTTTDTKPWHDGLNSDALGWAQNKGWLADNPREAFEKAVSAHREAQKLIGVPETELVRWPKDAGDPNWVKLRERLGVPKEAKDYDFATVKNAAGEGLDNGMADMLRATSAANYLTKEQAAALAQSVVKHIDQQNTGRAAELAASVQAERAALDKNWGANRAAFEVVAKTTLEKLGAAAGLTGEQTSRAWDALSKTGGIGASYAMEMLRVIGARIGEDRWVGGGGNGQSTVMTRESARAEIDALKADPQFAKRYTEGGAEERKRMNALHAVAFGTANAA